DSGIPHSVSGDEYTSVRVGAFMGYRIIADRAGLAAEPGAGRGRVVVEDPSWAGYLANISPAEFEAKYAALLPDLLSGSQFISKYQGTTDSVTQVDPNRKHHVPTA